VTYACTAVSKVGSATSKIGCEDFIFDGVFDGDMLDGHLTLTADIDDYK
jgi:hypothetical protein